MNKQLLISLLLLVAFSKAVTSQTTDFTHQNNDTSNCLPIDILFTQTSSGNPVGYLWDFGNGTRSNVANPVATFTEAGTFTVRLITVYANNTAEKTKNITIHPAITAHFNSDNDELCHPGIINFTAASSGSLGHYSWDFGDGTAVITGTSNNISHNFTQYGEFTVNFQAVSSTGCVVSSSEVIKITQPEVSGTITTAMTGCVPINTHFKCHVNLTQNSSVTNYHWNFGDGSSMNTTTSQVNHSFTQTGSYLASVTITTVEGCTTTFNYDSLFFGKPPINGIAYAVESVYCGSETAQFVAKATYANRYDWNFAGGEISSFTDTAASHRYLNLGVKNVTVVPVFNGCNGTQLAVQVKIIGVIAKYEYANTCSNKKTFLFTNTSVGNISTLNWTIDGQSSTNPDTISHSFPQSGTFAVKLLISDNITGCVDSLKTKIYTANPIMKNDDHSICINTDTHFSMLNNYENPGLLYTWNILGQQFGPDSNAVPMVHADTLGTFESQAILDNGSQYCPDTIHLDHMITVKGPQLDFSAPESLCLNTALTVVNLSHPFQASDSVKLWYWNFGRVEANDTIYQPQPYVYHVARNYRVKLFAVDVNGCMDSLVKKVTMRPMPFIYIIPRTVTLCEGQNSTLTGYTSDSISWTGATNSIACATCDTTVVTPVQTTKYYATATNSFNCVATDSSFVKVFNHFDAAPLTPDTSFCGGGNVQLSVEPSGKLITWSPSLGLSNANAYNPTASPKGTTTYSATLTDSAGCFTSNVQIKISVKSAPVIEAGANKVYPYNTAFTFTPTYSANIRTWLWSPADSLSCAACPNPSGVATGTKTYTVKVISDSGCIAEDRITVMVDCNGSNIMVPNAFTPNNDGRNDLFRPITKGIEYVKRFAIFNRQGQLVYERKNYSSKENVGWDGKFKGKDQDAAAYVYMVDAVCSVGEPVVSKGSFVLIR